MSRARNNVAAFTGAQCTDVDTSHTAAVTRNTHHLNNRVAGCSKSVAAGIRFFTGVGRFAFECHVKLGCAEQAVGSSNDFARIRHEGNMASEEVVSIVNNAGSSNGAGAANAFFSRLEDDLELAFEFVFALGNPVSQSQTDRDMGVMTTSVHKAGVLASEAFFVRFVFGIIGFVYANAVDIETECSCRAFFACVEQSNAASVAFGFVNERLRNSAGQSVLNAFLNEFFVTAEYLFGIDDLCAEQDFIAPGAQLVDDVVSGPEFGPAFFRPLMKLTSLFDKLLGVISHFFSF